jgi:hypothetical protein
VDCPCGLPVWTACLCGRGGPAAKSGWARGVRNHNVDVQRRRNCKPCFAVGCGGGGPSPSFVGQHAAAHSRRQTADGRQLGTCLLLLMTEALQPTLIRQPATGRATLQRAPSPTINCQLSIVTRALCELYIVDRPDTGPVVGNRVPGTARARQSWAAVLQDASAAIAAHPSPRSSTVALAAFTPSSPRAPLHSCCRQPATQPGPGRGAETRVDSLACLRPASL